MNEATRENQRRRRRMANTPSEPRNDAPKGSGTDFGSTGSSKCPSAPALGLESALVPARASNAVMTRCTGWTTWPSAPASEPANNRKRKKRRFMNQMIAKGSPHRNHFPKVTHPSHSMEKNSVTISSFVRIRSRLDMLGGRCSPQNRCRVDFSILAMCVPQ